MDRAIKSDEYFSITTKVDVRFSDTDMHGHVNNATISTYFEIGRDSLLRKEGATISGPERTFVLAQHTVRFIHEVIFPGFVDVSSAVEKIGRSSVGIRQIMMQNDSVCAESMSTIVYFNQMTRKAEPLSDQIRQLLEMR